MPGLWRSQANRVQTVAVELCWRPAEGESSGDFHDVIDLTDGRVVVVLGDAPAFGPVAAELGEELRFELRKAFRALRDGPAALNQLDQKLATRDADTIATVVCAVLDPSDRTADVTNAGHLPILMTSSSGTHFLQERVDPPLGVPTERRAVRYPLAADTALFLFTDGLVERRGSSLGEGLATILRCSSGLTGGAAGAAELARRTTDRMGQPTDDATVMSVRLRPTTPQLGQRLVPPLPSRAELRLYLDPADVRSSRAEAVVAQLSAQLAGRVELDVEVIDITVSSEAAEQDGVMAAPTVIRLAPKPALRVVGGLRSPGELARALQLPHAEEIP